MLKTTFVPLAVGARPVTVDCSFTIGDVHYRYAGGKLAIDYMGMGTEPTQNMLYICKAGQHIPSGYTAYGHVRALVGGVHTTYYICLSVL